MVLIVHLIFNMRLFLISVLFSISIFCSNEVIAQEADTTTISFSDTLDVNLPDSVISHDTLAIDTTLSLEKEIDENLNDIFSAKMDSLTNSWDIQNKFHFDTTEVYLTDSYPRNLPDSIYIKRLQETEAIVDLSYNKVVRNFIKMYTEKRRDQVEVMLGLSAYYFPIFEETLDKYDMPLELKYLAIINQL